MASTAQAGVYVPTFQLDEQRHRKKIASWAQWINQGHLANVGNLTLLSGTVSTVVVDSRVSLNSFIGLEPTTANALSAAPKTFVSTTTKGSFTLTHASTGSGDCNFRYCLLG